MIELEDGTVLNEVTEQEITHTPIESHSYVQRGIEVVCESCPNTHGHFLKPGEMLSLNDQGVMSVVKMVPVESVVIDEVSQEDDSDDETLGIDLEALQE